MLRSLILFCVCCVGSATLMAQSLLPMPTKMTTLKGKFKTTSNLVVKVENAGSILHEADNNFSLYFRLSASWWVSQKGSRFGFCLSQARVY